MAHATFCDTPYLKSLKPYSNSRSAFIQGNELVCAVFSILAPELQKQAQEKSDDQVRDNRVSEGRTKRPIVRNGKMIREKKDGPNRRDEEEAAFFAEISVTEKNVVESITSENPNANYLAQEVLFRALMLPGKYQLPWKRTPGRRHFLILKIRELAEKVRGVSEEEFFQLYDLFLDEVLQDKRFFGNHKRPKKKERPWTQEFNSKEIHRQDFVLGQDQDPAYDE